MAPRRIVYEQCDLCKERAAIKVGARIYEGHACPNEPPGPPTPPMVHKWGDVKFEPHPFTAEFLRDELEECTALVIEMRASQLKMRMALETIGTVMRNYEAKS